jgi:hypothetical protein
MQKSQYWTQKDRKHCQKSSWKAWQNPPHEQGSMTTNIRYIYQVVQTQTKNTIRVFSL